MTPGVRIINGKKTFIPIENNPSVLTHLTETLGVQGIHFHDILTLDETFLSTIPRPVHGLIFLCSSSIYHTARDAEEATMPEYTGSGPSEPVIWFKQTIGHACGLMALLHCLANGKFRSFIPAGSELDELFNQAIPLSPAKRAKLLYDSEFIENAHMNAATRGTSKIPTSADPVGYHYIAFVKAKDGFVWELNGGMKGPVRRGYLGEEDLLGKLGLEMSVGGFLDGDTNSEDVGVSLVAVTG